MTPKCKKIVWSGPRPQGLTKSQCRRKALENGYCWQHDPIEVKKREEHRAKKHEAVPFNMLHTY